MKFSARDLYEIEGQGLLEDSASWKARWTLEEYDSELKSPLSLSFFCENPRGFVLYRSLGPAEIEIMNLAVQEKARGHGRRLMTQFLSSLQDSVKMIYLELRANNQAALGLYTSFGFQKVGLRREYYRNGDSAILMSKSIG